MKTVVVGLSILVACAASSASALDKIRITDSKKTVEKRESDAQKLAHGSTSLSEKQVIYTFSLQRMAPDAPETVTVSWVLVREGMNGRLAEASRGSSVAVLPLGRTTDVVTEPVELEEREWTHRKGSGSISSSLAGYGLRIQDGAGNVIVERYDPKSIQSEVNWEPRADERMEKWKRKQEEESLRQQLRPGPRRP